MDEKDTKDLLNRAIEEIESLRRRNELLSAKVEMIDLFAATLFSKPAMSGQGFAPDVVFELRRRVSEIEADDTAPADPPNREPAP